MGVVEVLDPVAPARAGGWKVDVSRGERNGRVSSEWFNRPDDERYLSLDDLWASVKGRSERSRSRVVQTADIRVEATRDLALEPVPVDTPLETTSGWSVRGKKLTLVPILRAGLGMVEGILRLMPSARVGHIGLYRDHDTLEPVDYYFKVPGDVSERDFLLLDPMLAPERLLYRLFHERGVTVYEPGALRHACRCSREGISLLLLSLGREEVDKIVAEQGKVEVTCEFCGKDYHYSRSDAVTLFVAEGSEQSVLKH